ncbi:nucleotidyltransferase [Streptomyces acidiscabies]|uniref:nucleotidyltransferase n=1 Tax=Streptomyces acidiscabies TaxID=42234 RepID=UPI0030D625A0
MNVQVGAAFNRFYELITPSRQHVEQALARARILSANMRDAAREVAPCSFMEHRLMGSYTRGTAIREFSDVDVMFEFQCAMGSGLAVSRPLLAGIRNFLKQTVDASVRVSEMQEVVRIEYPDGICLDILPSLRGDPQGYFIPDGVNGWKATDPDVQERYFKRQDAASKIRLSKFTRGLKYWNATHGNLVRSYHLESLVAQLAPQLDGDYAIATREVFEELSNTISILDPSGHQGDLSAYLSASQRDMIASLCRASGEGAMAALDAQAKGKCGQALKAWAAVYGPLFPSDGPSLRGWKID